MGHARVGPPLTLVKLLIYLLVVVPFAFARKARHEKRVVDVAEALDLVIADGAVSGVVLDVPVRITSRWEAHAADPLAPAVPLVFPLLLMAGWSTGMWWLILCVVTLGAWVGLQGSLAVTAQMGASFSATSVSTYGDVARSTMRSGDPTFDDLVDLRGWRLAVMARMTSPVRQRIRKLIATGGRVGDGSVRGRVPEWMPTGEVVAVVRRVAALAAELNRDDQWNTVRVATLATATGEPFEVRLEAAEALLECAEDHPATLELRERLFAGRYPQQALADGGVTALFALEHLAESGRPDDVRPIERFMRDQPERVQEAATRAVARIRERVGDSMQGALSMTASSVSGGLSTTSRAGDISPVSR